MTNPLEFLNKIPGFREMLTLRKAVNREFVETPNAFARRDELTLTKITDEQTILEKGVQSGYGERMRLWGDRKSWPVEEQVKRFADRVMNGQAIQPSDDEMMRYFLGLGNHDFRIKGGEQELIRKSRMVGLLRETTGRFIEEGRGSRAQAIGEVLKFFDPRSFATENNVWVQHPQELARWLTAFAYETSVAWLHSTTIPTSVDSTTYPGSNNLNTIYQAFGEMKEQDIVEIGHLFGMPYYPDANTVNEFSIYKHRGQGFGRYIDITMGVPQVAGDKGTKAWNLIRNT